MADDNATPIVIDGKEFKVTVAELERYNKLVADGKGKQEAINKVIGERAVLERESVDLIGKRVEGLKKALELNKADYAQRVLTQQLQVESSHLDAATLKDMTDQVLAGRELQEVVAGTKYEYIQSFGALANQLQSTNLIFQTRKGIKKELETTTNLESKIVGTATKMLVIHKDGLKMAYLKNKAHTVGDGIITSTLKLGWDLIKQFDSLTKEFEKQFQLGPRYTEMIKNNWQEQSKFGVSLEETTKAQAALITTVTDYTLMGAAQQKQLALSATRAQELGVAFNDYAQGIQNSTKMMGMSMGAAQVVQDELAATARALGRDQGEFAAAFAKSGSALAKFGNQGVKAFKDLQRISKITGMEMDKVLQITNKFDTFEGAADQAGKLNAALGGNFVNAMDLMMATDPAERFEMIRGSILDAGLSFDDMSYYQKNFYKDALGLSDVGDLALMLSGRMDLLGDSTNQSAESIEQQRERAQALVKVQDAWQLILTQNAQELTELAGTIQWVVAIALEFSWVIKGLLPLYGAYRLATMGLAVANTWLALSQTAVGESAFFSKRGLWAMGIALSMFSVWLMMRSPSLLVAALFGMAGAVFALGRMSESSAAQVQALAIPMLQLGAAVFLAAAGLALMALSFSLLSVEQMVAMAVVLVALGVGLYFVAPALIAAGSAAMGVAPGLLLLAGVIFAIGAGVGMAAAGIGLMGAGMALLFKSIDPAKIVWMNLMMASLLLAAPFMPLAAGGMIALAYGLGSVGFALALIKTEDLQALAQFASAMAAMEVESMNELAEAIERIADAIDGIDPSKSIRFESNIDALTELEDVRQLTAQRAAVGTATSIEYFANTVNAGGGNQGGQRYNASAAEVITKQPVELKLNGDKMGEFVITTVGARSMEVNGL